jgi:hypothetical protein
MRPKNQIKLPIPAGIEFEAIGREDLERADSVPGSKKIIQSQEACRRRREGPIQEHRVDARMRIAADFFDVGFFNPVPVFEGGFHIARQEVERGEEVVCVRIVRIQVQDLPDKCSRLRTVSLLESDTGQFEGKSLVVGRLDLAFPKGSFSFLPLLQGSQRHPSIIVKVRGVMLRFGRQLKDGVPFFLYEESPDLFGPGRCVLGPAVPGMEGNGEKPEE